MHLITLSTIGWSGGVHCMNHLSSSPPPFPECFQSASRPIVHPFTCADDRFHVCSVLPQSLPSITLPLLQTMFYR